MKLIFFEVNPRPLRKRRPLQICIKKYANKSVRHNQLQDVIFSHSLLQLVFKQKIVCCRLIFYRLVGRLSSI